VYRDRVVALLAFAGLDAALQAAHVLRGELDSLEAVELFLEPGLALVCEKLALARPFARPHEAYVLVEAADRRDPTEDLSAVVARLDGLRDAAVASDAHRRAELWRYREGHTTAINLLGPPHKLDVTVPIGGLGPFMHRVPDVVADLAPNAVTWLFGHAGDGNVHVNITGLDPDDERVDEAVLELVASMGGSISAEHGIGTAKRRWLRLAHTDAEIAAMAAIKDALDPDRILNPNALLPRAQAR
jgi:FAD/FMN-containing dehydrogenase